MRRGLQVSTALPPVLYFGVLIPGPWTLLMLLVAALASLPAFIYLLLNRGPRPAWQLLLMFVPFVGAIVAIIRILERSTPMLVLAAGCWAYPFFVLGEEGSRRFTLALLGAVALWALLTFCPPFNYQPAMTSLFVLALPMTSLVLIASIVMPLTAALSDVDAAIPDQPDGDFSKGQDPMWMPSDQGTSDWIDASMMDDETNWESISNWQNSSHWSDAGLTNDPQSSSGSLWSTDINGTPREAETYFTTPPQSANPNWGEPGASTELPSAHGLNNFSHDHHTVASVDDAPASLTGIPDESVDHVTHATTAGGNVREVQFDPITGNPTIHTDSGNIRLTFSEVSDRLVGHLPDGSKVEVWGSPVTGDVHVDVGGRLTRFHFDNADGLWHGSGHDDSLRISQDPITGALRMNSPNVDASFRWDPFQGRLIADGRG